MSNIYIQEPPTLGKVLLTTSVGDIDIELWSKETPKACRNFIQLVMEGYYDDTIFHRVVKEFIVQGGDPLGTGEGGESIYGEPFKDEIHSRLRFNRRGLVAMANGGPNDNGSQFFFTLGPAGELNKKHTIFGKVAGQTLYNMLKLEDGDVDENERPSFPHKIIKGEILSCPFDDIVPRQIKVKRSDSGDEKKTKSKSKATKNFNLLSFGEEAEEDEEETDKVSQTMRGKSKSSHDLIDDPRLSSVPAVEVEEGNDRKRKSISESEDSDIGTEVRKKLKSSEVDKSKDSKASDDKTVSDEKRKEEQNKDIKKKESTDGGHRKETSEAKKVSEQNSDNTRRHGDGSKKDEHGKEGKDEKNRKKESHEHRKNKETVDENSMSKSGEMSKDLPNVEKGHKDSSVPIPEKKGKEDTDTMQKVDMLEEYKLERQRYKDLRQLHGRKGSKREADTLAMLDKFKNKLKSVNKDEYENEPAPVASDDESSVTDTTWLGHKLCFEDNAKKVLDANITDVDRYEIYDPRNPLTKRRREASKVSKSSGKRDKL